MNKEIIAIMILITVATMADIEMTDEGCKMIFNRISKYHDKHQKSSDNKFKKEFQKMKSFYNRNCLYKKDIPTYKSKDNG